MCFRNDLATIVWLADISVKNWRNLHISTSKPNLHNINVHTIWWKSTDINSNYHPETKMRTRGWQITQSKTNEICPLAIPNQTSTISMHIHVPSFVKIHWHLLKLLSKNKNMDGWMCNSQKEAQTDRHTHERPTWNHNNLPLSCGKV